MKTLAIVLALIAVLCGAVVAEAAGRRQVIVQKQVIVQQRQRVRVQRVVVADHHVQQFVQPVYAQQFVAPVYSQQFVAPVYSQQVIGGCQSYGGSLQLNGGGCSSFLRAY